MGEFSYLYGFARWRRLRLRQLQREPLCRVCQQEGRITLATICDHVAPHRGDMARFWGGPFQSLCKRCHDSTKKAIEQSGQAPARFDPRGNVLW
ncbi:MAG: hypothetical protein MUC86_05010 [Burkholderiaceae bacterium]|jgi:hypothetical protein|nr:hypothetical protein [Burkholderiaceae bacterium]